AAIAGRPTADWHTLPVAHPMLHPSGRRRREARRRKFPGGRMLMRTRSTISACLAGFIVAGLALGTATAQTSPTGVYQDPAVVEVPASVPTVTTITPGVVPSTLQADDIEAAQVRAQTIYANKIKASNVQGMVHQTKGVRIKHTKSDLKIPQVQAGTIYADVIKADSVVADNIYVRDMERK